MVVVERSACRDPKTLREAPAAIPSAGALRRQRSEGTLREPQISAFSGGDKRKIQGVNKIEI